MTAPAPAPPAPIEVAPAPQVKTKRVRQPRKASDWTPALLAAEFALQGIEPRRGYLHRCALGAVMGYHEISPEYNQLPLLNRLGYGTSWVSGLTAGFDGISISNRLGDWVQLTEECRQGYDLGKAVAELLWPST